jgi:hypothetical protein
VADETVVPLVGIDATAPTPVVVVVVSGAGSLVSVVADGVPAVPIVTRARSVDPPSESVEATRSETAVNSPTVASTAPIQMGQRDATDREPAGDGRTGAVNVGAGGTSHRGGGA